MLIRPDLEVWLVSDPELSSRWRELASLLQLTSSIPRLEVSRRRTRRDTDKVGELLRLWRIRSPNSYTVQRLLSVLDQLVVLARRWTFLSPHTFAGHEEHV